ncbi:paraneoplastic antigen Ma1 homolog [Archocentrus centrarchus]|uniref:paraneoplastic antigen Ma1 homolog n=1 Tax=Archocentrus centrarchus TaxID=63155 RepID=UPI0011E9FA55|nr:paraneoplastic antigen Ma1 homolog [Archocentrus centrarchus]
MDTNLVTRLKNWCSGETLDENHALLTVVPEHTEIAQIEDALQTIKCLGRVRVRGRMLSDTDNQVLVLCECRQKVTDSAVPKEVRSPDGLTAWPICVVAETPGVEEDFAGKLKALLEAEGKSAEDVQALLAGSQPVSPTESILRAVGDLLDKTVKPSPENAGHRRLRIFSGNIPTPAGEEQFDHWLEQAYLLVEECPGSPKEKRRRVIESLKGPALDVIKAVRLSDPDVTPEGCLEALESAFGLAESGDDLYFAFRLLQQQPGEKLSDFLRRLERALTKVVQRGGIPVNSMDIARVEQLLKGAVDADLMLINLRLRERRTKPPTFLELLREIRIEEEYEASRVKLNRSVSSVQVKPQADNRQSEIQSLKAELKEVKAMFAALATHSPAETEKGEKQLDSRELASENNVDPEVVALKKQVKQLQKKVGTRLSCQAGASPTVMAVGTPSARQSPDSEERFCYHCGENGHIAPKCNKPENQNKVIQRLLGVLKKTRGKPQPATGKTIPEEVAGTIRKSAVDVLESHGLPEGLIGPPLSH